MRNEFNKKQDLSQPPVRLQNRSPELSPRQSEIYRNLQAIGPEIAAFYLSGVKVLQDDDLETSSYLLAHIAREIEGGLRDVLSEKREEHLEFVVHMPNGKKLTYEKRVKDALEFVIDTPGSVKLTYKKVQGNHKASILQSLGVDENSPLAERWISVAKGFARFAHRHGAWKPPRRREAFVPLWHEFEDVLEDLVGNYLDLLIKVVDRILEYEKPTDKIRGVLPHLLTSDMRRKYFFENLASPTWLQPLKEDGWFDPESNVIVRPRKSSTKELDWYDWWKLLVDAQKFDFESSSLTKARTRVTETDVASPWHALEYVERMAEHTKKHPCDETIGTLVEIIDIIVDCAEDIKKKIIEDRYLCELIINIISALPKEKIKDKHNTFMELTTENRYNEYKYFMACGLDAYLLIESIEQGTNPALREFLSNISRADRIEFPGEIREIVDGKNRRIAELEKNVYTEQGLENIYREYVVVILQRLRKCLSMFQDVLLTDLHSILSELLIALHDKKEFDWETFLEFIRELLSLEHFWAEQEVNGFKYRDQILADAAELIAIGTNNDNHAFDSQLLPLAEQILLILVEKAESTRIIQKGPYSTFLSSSKGMVFRGMMGYALRFAHTENTKKVEFRWPQAIRANFTKRLDRNIEPSFEFSFMLGTYLPQLLYLDQQWVIDNVNCIFPKHDEHHWYVAFSMYLLNSDKIDTSLYFIFKEGGHYQKALNTNFDHHAVENALATHICKFWLEGYEELSDQTSFIYQVVNSSNVNYLSAIVDFCWDQRDNLSEKDKAKVRAAWRVMFKTLSENKDEEVHWDEKVYPNILDKLSKWVIFIDRIDEEALEWLKLSVRHVTWDIRILVETLLTHASETPREVGIIYLELSKRGIGDMLGSFLDQDKAIETVRILYEAGCTEAADQICIQFAEDGLNFLKPLYNEYQH